MYLLNYLGPAFLVAALIFAAIGHQEGMELSVIAWMAFTFIGGVVAIKPRNIPEWVMTMGNAAIFSLAFVAALLGWI